MSRSTARSWPTWPSTTPPAFAALVETAKAALPEDVNAPRAEAVGLTSPVSSDRRWRACRRLTSPSSPRGAAGSRTARKLARRASRAEHRLFLAEGPQARPRGARRRPAACVEVFADPSAADRAVRRPARRRRRRRRRLAARRRRGAGLADRDGAPRRAWSRSAGSSTEPLADVLDRRPAPAGRVCADVRDPGNAGTVIRCADAAGADGVVLAGTRSTPTTARPCGPRVGIAVPPAARPWRRPGRGRVAALQAAGFAVLAADGAGEIDLDDAAGRRACSPGRRPGCSATRPGGCPTSSPRWPTTGSASRSTAAPRASTWPPPRPSASTTRPARTVGPAADGATDGHAADVSLERPASD